MEIKEIQNVVDGWHKITWEVIEFKNPGLDKIKSLFQNTFEIIKKYREESLVPKEISSMLLEMHDFGWWVSNLAETPLHNNYQEIVSLISTLKKYFLTRDCDVETIKNNIEKITEGAF